MDRKIIANKELEVIGGKPKVYRYWDEKEKKYWYSILYG